MTRPLIEKIMNVGFGLYADYEMRVNTNAQIESVYPKTCAYEFYVDSKVNYTYFYDLELYLIIQMIK